MADTDMLLPEDTIDRLLKHDKDIVAGLAFSAGLSGTRVTPNIREIVETDNGSPTIQPIWDYPRDTLLQVDGVGAACLLVKRNVAEVILQARGEDHPAPWFAYGAHNGVLIGEDIAFCLTAMKCGFKIWVDTGLIIPHVKTTAIDDEAYVLSLNMESHPHYDMREKVPVWNDYYGNLS